MTDEARLARLTELARRLWQHEEDQPVTVERGLRGCDPATAFVRTGNGIVLDIAAPNDRALDALEAAMLVLSEETSIGAVRRTTYPKTMQAMEKRVIQLENVIEQLAEEWEASARRLRKGVEDTTDMTERMTYFFRADVWERCARELRERARGGA